MSKRTQHQRWRAKQQLTETVALARACPRCQAKVGENCVTAYEQVGVYPHSERKALAMEVTK